VYIFKRYQLSCGLSVVLQVTFRWQEVLLILDPLRGEVDVDRSETKVGKVKVEIHLFKKSTGRWGGLVGEAPAGESAPIPIPL